MVYYGTCIKEIIMIHQAGAEYYIEMTKSADSSVFWVACNYGENFIWEFDMTDGSDYERVKYNIMYNIFECKTMSELLYYLSEVFEECFDARRIHD